MRLDNAFLTQHDYYEVMGLGPEATRLDIDTAFKERSAQLDLRHPEEAQRVESAEQMLVLTQAYETLSDPILRSRYDLQLLGRQEMPMKDQVEILFKEGIRAWRGKDTDLALRYLKEVASLYPHRPLFRVHLAIAYADKNWLTFTESELETALRLDPGFKFAKETVAKLLFKLPDKRHQWHQNKMNRQIVATAAAFVLVGVILASGVLQGAFASISAKISASTQAQKIQNTDLQSQLPEDMKMELEQKQTQQVKAISIPYFEADYQPEGKVFDYSQQEAKDKVFYPDQSVVVVTYADGSTLTYRPPDLKGWKHNKAGVPIMITANNEMIPSPSSLTLKLPGNKPANLQDPAFPSSYFPEYGAKPAVTTQPVAPAAATPIPVQNSGTYNPYGGR